MCVSGFQGANVLNHYLSEIIYFDLQRPMILKSKTSKIFRLKLSLYFKTSMAVNDVNISKTRNLLYIESSL